MKSAFILLIFFLLAPSPQFLSSQEVIGEFEVGTLQQKKKIETSSTMSGGAINRDGAFTVPAGNTGDNPPQAIGIPANKTSSIRWLPYIILTLSLSALAAWIIFRKRYSTTKTTGTAMLMESYQDLHQEDSDEDPKDTALISAVKDDEEDKQATKIKEFMAAEQQYLDPEFTIKRMADQLDMEVRELSLLLNNCFQQNFYDFLNLYRIEKAKEILRDPQNKKLTVLEILYSVGYNSKSSFNTSFRKLTGLTPTQYRRKYCEHR